jgi:hypothetical protein
VNSIREKYNKVKKLVSEGATEGERSAAKEAMLRMEQKYPELLKRKTIPEDVFKGYQANVTWDEFTNLSEDILEQLLTKFPPKGTWVGSSTYNSVTHMWQENLDGTWKEIK